MDQKTQRVAMYDVITIGAATRDVFLVSDEFVTLASKKFATGKGECVTLGSKIEIQKLTLTTGGGATNAAATFAQLGFHTATICRVGDDAPGKDVVEDLSRFGVSTHLVRMIKDKETAYSTILTMKDGERTILVYRGTSADFVMKDIPLSAIAHSKWIYLTSIGGNFAIVQNMIRSARKKGVRIAWNPGRKELERGLKAIKPLLPMVEILNMNLEEATYLTGKKRYDDIFKLLHDDGCIRLVTDGTNGATVERDGWMARASTTGVKAISRTGAGDAFGSGFLAGLIKSRSTTEDSLHGSEFASDQRARSNDDLKEALRVGMVNAESVILKYGAKEGILKQWPTTFKKRRVKITVV